MSEGGGQRGTRQPLFLERRSYRRRRLVDAARLLPVLGLLLWLVPLLWGIGGRDVSASGAGIYIFGVWAALVAVAAGFAVALGRPARDDREAEEPPHRQW